MRSPRVLALLAVSVLVTAASVSVAGAAGAAPAAGPTAPYDAFAIDGPLQRNPVDDNWTVLPPVLDDSNSTFTAGVGSGSIEVGATLYTIQPVDLGPMQVTHYNIGTGTGDARFTSNDGSPCSQPTGGFLDVLEVSQDAQQHYQSLAMDFSITCLNGLTYTGLLRFNSTIGYVAVDDSEAPLKIADVYQQVTSAPKVLTVTNRGSLPYHVTGAAALSGASATSFRIVDDSCDGVTLAPDETCTISVTARPRTTGVLQADLTWPDNSVAGEHQIQVTVHSLYTALGKYVGQAPYRTLDTRNGTGVRKGVVTGGHAVRLPLAGRAPVPASGVSAVVLNLTVTGTTSAGFVTAYPSGAARPSTSSVNFPRSWTGANMVTVRLGSGGAVDLYLSGGQANLVADVVGYYSASPTLTPTAVPYHPVVSPFRLYDSRHDNGTHRKLASRYEREIGVWFDGVTNSTVKALAINLTVTGVSATGGYVVAYDGVNGNYAWEFSSTLNPRAHETTANLALVNVKTCRSGWCAGANASTFRVYNGTAHSIDFIVDVVGFYSSTSASGATVFTPLSQPSRIVDTRTSLGTSALGSATSHTVSPPTTLANYNTAAFAANVTAVSPTANTYLTLWPKITGFSRPAVSNLNPIAGRTVANATQLTVGESEDFNIYNASGRVNVLVDVAGTFQNFPEILPPAGSPLHGAAGQRAGSSRPTFSTVQGSGIGPTSRPQASSR